MSEAVPPAIGRVKEIGFSWRSEIGRATATFAVSVLEETRQGDSDAYIVEVLAFKQCHYTPADGSPVHPAAVTTLEELPTGLQAEIDLLLGTTSTVARAVVEEGLITYVENPRPQ